MEPRVRKMASLREGEFYPHEYFKGKAFVRIPILIAEHKHLSLGAKMLYGVLLGLAPSGAAWPKKEFLKNRMGGASVRTIYRWQTELENAGLITVKQKGRGLSNNYYFLKSHIIGNALAPATPPPGSGTSETKGVDSVPGGEYPPSPNRSDYASDKAYEDAIRDWELQFFSPLELFELYGQDGLRSRHGVEARKRDDGSIALVRLQPQTNTL